MINQSPTSIIFFAIGCILGYTAAAILLLSVAALVIRHRRRALIASISTLSWIVVVTGAACGLAYVAEILFAWQHGNAFERAAFANRFSGASAWLFWLQAFGSVLAPQLFWFRRSRRNAWLSLAISAAVLAPANIERLIVYLTAHSDYLPNSWQQ